MQNWFLAHAFSLVSGPIVALLVTFAYEGLQKTFTVIDGSSPTAKRIGATLLAAVLTPLAQSVGVSLPVACSGAALDLTACVTGLADKGWLTTVIGAVLSLGLHQVLIAKPKSVPTA